MYQDCSLCDIEKFWLCSANKQLCRFIYSFSSLLDNENTHTTNCTHNHQYLLTDNLHVLALHWLWVPLAMVLEAVC